ncbi:hypothetical protein [Streptomyces zagrosensis]|uniref:Uncharacterized protein n=1 Tax=Streptomyces zagrosensis TaxID=1042984 RepID=A0A7W9QFN8_9ACTN|nr:hypothetical protein [Streptomyces zagrosensis]MBB5939400.1 hypothetical protein [Streptomyces zagrosensis]
MNITQQYALDLYRSAQHGEPAPPAPGRHDWRTVRELREHHTFQTVVAERAVGHGPASRLLRAARSTLIRWLRPATIRGSAGSPTAAAETAAANHLVKGAGPWAVNSRGEGAGDGCGVRP